MYLVLAALEQEATGRSWEDLVSKRVLTPLHMNDTLFSFPAMQDKPDHAKGYDLQEGEYKELPTFDISFGNA